MLQNIMSSDELKALGAVLDKGKDKGWFSLTELHGFLSAIVSGPDFVPPSVWMPYAFGEHGFDFQTKDQAQKFMISIMRLNNHIIMQLTKEAPSEPILYSEGALINYKASDELLTLWCSAYLTGSELNGIWDYDFTREHDEGEDVFDEDDFTEEDGASFVLFPLSILSNEVNLIGEKDAEGNIIDDDITVRTDLKEILPVHLMWIYNIFLSERKQYTDFEAEGNATERNYLENQEKIGRNEPCPCNSGKKYKKCCLNAEPVSFH